MCLKLLPPTRDGWRIGVSWNVCLSRFTITQIVFEEGSQDGFLHNLQRTESVPHKQDAHFTTPSTWREFKSHQQNLKHSHVILQCLKWHVEKDGIHTKLQHTCWSKVCCIVHSYNRRATASSALCCLKANSSGHAHREVESVIHSYAVLVLCRNINEWFDYNTVYFLMRLKYISYLHFWFQHESIIWKK